MADDSAIAALPTNPVAAFSRAAGFVAADKLALMALADASLLLIAESAFRHGFQSGGGVCGLNRAGIIAYSRRVSFATIL